MDLPPVEDLGTAKILLSISLGLIALLGGIVLFFLKGLYNEVKSFGRGLTGVQRDVAVIKAIMTNFGLTHLSPVNGSGGEEGEEHGNQCD